MLYSAVVPCIRTACSGLLDYLYTTAPTTETPLGIPETDSRYDLGKIKDLKMTYPNQHRWPLLVIQSEPRLLLKVAIVLFLII